MTSLPPTASHISKHFTDRDSYYLVPPVDISHKPFIYAPEAELRVLLNEIRNELGIVFNLDKTSIITSFPDDGMPRPRYLGVSSSRNEAEALEKQAPKATYVAKGSELLRGNGDDRSLAAFLEKMKQGKEAIDYKSRVAKEHKEKKRSASKAGKYHPDKFLEASTILTTLDSCGQLARTGRYLGFRQQELVVGLPPPHSATDLSKPAPFPFEGNVIFVSVDLEWWEQPPSPCTEVGIATLDTDDLVGLAPGPGCANWLARIRPVHLRVREHADKVNRTYLVGCPDRFEFGASEFIGGAEVAGRLGDCFRTPLRAQYGPGKQSTFGRSFADTHRPVVFVGHDPHGDIAKLRTLGFHLEACATLFEVIDTAQVYRALCHSIDPNEPGLATVLAKMELVGWNMHNAVRLTSPFLPILPPIPSTAFSFSSLPQT